MYFSENLNVENLINSIDSIIRVSFFSILSILQKCKNFLQNVYLIYIFFLIISSIGIILSIKYSVGLLDMFSSLPLLFFAVLVLMSLGKVHLSHKKSRLKNSENEKYFSETLDDDFQLETQDYTHRKNKTKSIEKRILDFHANEAKKYFDICEYSFEQLAGKLYDKKQIAFVDKILLHKDLMNLEIRTLLEDLKEITGIPMNTLEMLFMRFCSRDKKYVNVKSSIVNSSKSQSVRF